MREGRARSSATRPASIDSCTEATIRRAPSSATSPVAELEDLGEVVPGVDVHDREGEPRRAQNAFWARWSMTTESLPPEKSSTGRSNSAATSRMMWIDSASRVRRWDSWYWPGRGAVRVVLAALRRRPGPEASIRHQFLIKLV